MTVSTDLSMSDAKAEACASCPACVVSEAAPGGPVPYEIHVTVEEAEVESFKARCGELGVKPLFLALQLKRGGAVRDVMTSSVHVGDDESARREAGRIETGLAASGLRVVRNKIETVPWHPCAPSRTNGLRAAPGRYFEAHLAVTCRLGDRDRLAPLAADLGLHLSRNVMKDNGDGSGTVMATARSYDAVYEDFRELAESRKASIEAAGFEVAKLIVEFAMSDSRDTHDAAWVAA